MAKSPFEESRMKEAKRAAEEALGKVAAGQGEAKKEDINEASAFIEKLQEGYHHFVVQNRHNIFSGAFA